MTYQVGDTLCSKYRLTRLRGVGGMGAVYEARHVVLGKAFAIKLLHPQYSAHPEVFKRFQLEAQAAAAIGHPGIVDVYDIGQTDDGSPFLVMELLRGESLAELLDRQTRLDTAAAAEVVAQTLQALIAVHDKKILHRDLKPENIFLNLEVGRGWSTKILDFGISKVNSPDAMRLTMTGLVLGTAHYMSPEQARGAKDVDLRADLWAAGAVLYRALTGKHPFDGDSYNEVLAKILSDPVNPPRASQPEIPEALERVVLKAMAKDRSERYASAADFLDDLEPFRPDPGDELSPWDGLIPEDEDDEEDDELPSRERSSKMRVVDIEDSKPTAAFAVEDADHLDQPVTADAKPTTPWPARSSAAQVGVLPETCMIPTEHREPPRPEWELPPLSPPPDTLDAAVNTASALRSRRAVTAMTLVGLALAVLGVVWVTRSPGPVVDRTAIGDDVASPQTSAGRAAGSAGPADEIEGLGSTISTKDVSPFDVTPPSPLPETPEPSGRDLQPSSPDMPSPPGPSRDGSSTPRPAPPSTHGPRPATPRQIDAALRSRRGRLQRCLAASRTAPATVRVRLAVSSGGSISYSGAAPAPPPSVSACFRDALAGARLDSGPMEPATHVVVLRRERRQEPVKREGPLWESPF